VDYRLCVQSTDGQILSKDDKHQQLVKRVGYERFLDLVGRSFGEDLLVPNG